MFHHHYGWGADGSRGIYLISPGLGNRIHSVRSMLEMRSSGLRLLSGMSLSLSSGKGLVRRRVGEKEARDEEELEGRRL
jgi:hypothetical protein